MLYEQLLVGMMVALIRTVVSGGTSQVLGVEGVEGFRCLGFGGFRCVGFRV